MKSQIDCDWPFQSGHGGAQQAPYYIECHTDGGDSSVKNVEYMPWSHLAHWVLILGHLSKKEADNQSMPELRN